LRICSIRSNFSVDARGPSVHLVAALEKEFARYEPSWPVMPVMRLMA